MINIKTKNNHPYFYWHLEVSSKCSLSCPRCPRTEHPDKFVVTELDLNFVKKVFTKDILEQTQRILFCGGEGDPIYCKEFIQILKYFKDFNPDIQIIITTNGSYKTKKWWIELSEVLSDIDTIIFSVDGWDNQSNNLYRANSNFDSIITGITTLREHNKVVNITWSTILFRFNQDKIDTIISIANSVGASVFQLVKSTLFGSKISKYIDPLLGYDALEPVDISNFNWHERAYVMLDSYKITESRLTANNKHNNNIKYLRDNYITTESDILPGCQIGERALYINAQGRLFPCSWISHPFVQRSSTTRKKSVNWEQHWFNVYKDQFDLHVHSIDEVLNSSAWTNLQKSFSCTNNKFVECEQKCSVNSTSSRLKNILKIED